MTKWKSFFPVILAVAVFVASYYFFAKPKGESSLLSQVPADTVYYAGGSLPDDLVEYTLASFNGALNFRYQMIMDEMMADIAADATPQVKFFNHFLAEFKQHEGSAVAGAMDLFGISLIKEYALYSHGAVPVLKLKLLDGSHVERKIDEAVAASDWQYRAETIDNVKLRFWPIVEASEYEPKIELGVAQVDDVLSISFVVGDDDSLQKKKERFGLSKPELSLADAGTIQQLSDKYQMSDLPVAFIDFEKIVAGILGKTQTTLGDDLRTYLPAEEVDQAVAELQASCADIEALITKVPRFVAGYTAVDIKGDTLHSSMLGVLEINNEALMANLKKLQGYVPAHASKNDGQIVSYGVGVDASQWASVVSDLIAQAASSNLSCGEILPLEVTNEALGAEAFEMFPDLAKIKGVGISLYEFSANMEDPVEPFTLKAMLSINSDDPRALVNAAASSTGMAIDIPEDKTFADIEIPTPMFPLSLKVAATEDQLLIITDPSLEDKAKKAMSMKTSQKALIGMSLDYSKYTEIIMNSLPLLGGSSQSCSEIYEVKEIFSKFDMRLNSSTKFTSDGLVFGFDAEQRNSAKQKVKLSGDFDVYSYSSTCELEAAGHDVFGDDGQGESLQEEEGCVIYSSKHQWKQQGLRIDFMPEKESYRSSCDEELEVEVEPEAYSCYMMNITEEGFNCIFDVDGSDPYLLHYTRK